MVIEPPEYHLAHRVVSVRARPRYRAEEVRQDVLRAIYRLFDPLEAARKGTGWPFGRSVQAHEVNAALARYSPGRHGRGGQRAVCSRQTGDRATRLGGAASPATPTRWCSPMSIRCGAAVTNVGTENVGRRTSGQRTSGQRTSGTENVSTACFGSDNSGTPTVRIEASQMRGLIPGWYRRIRWVRRCPRFVPGGSVRARTCAAVWTRCSPRSWRRWIRLDAYLESGDRPRTNMLGLARRVAGHRAGRQPIPPGGSVSWCRQASSLLHWRGTTRGVLAAVARSSTCHRRSPSRAARRGPRSRERTCPDPDQTELVVRLGVGDRTPSTYAVSMPSSRWSNRRTSRTVSSLRPRRRMTEAVHCCSVGIHRALDPTDGRHG